MSDTTTMTLGPSTTTKSVLMSMATRYGMEPAAFESTVRATCGCSGATREEFAAFLLVAKEYGLNPVTREIFAFPKKGGGIQPIVSIDGWLNMANSHPQFDGLDVTFEHDDQGRLVSATCTIHRKDRNHPVRVTEYLNECVRSTDPWKMAHRMLRHKAAIQGIRYAFGFSGIMEPDEAETITVQAQPVQRIRETPALPLLSPQDFMAQEKAWQAAIDAGRQTPQSILAMARTRWTVSEEGEQMILSLGRVEADGEIIDAEPVRGDAWEPETASTEAR